MNESVFMIAFFITVVALAIVAHLMSENFGVIFLALLIVLMGLLHNRKRG